MTIVGIIATFLNILCALINTCWGIYWIKRLEKSQKEYNELMQQHKI